MDAMQQKAIHKLNQRKPKSMKPKTHHFFWGLIVVCGWLAPPLAIVIRFGIGLDFFVNIILTILGYFPGHFHNFYCQNIRNNNNKARTPRWAVRYGLVEVKDPRAGKHQWAGRYDERLPDSSRHGYGSQEELPNGGAWDGRGPEPPAKDNRHGRGNRSGGFSLSPWSNQVNADEVEGGARGVGLSRTNTSRSNTAYDPLSNEEFYASGTGTGDAPGASAPKPKKGGLLKHRGRYENASAASSGDRFDRMAAARGGESEYQDEFEASLHRNASKGAGSSSRNGAAPLASPGSEGPEDAWASVKPQKTGSQAASNSQAEAPARKAGLKEDFLNHDF